MTNYAKGARNEHRVMEWLQREGYTALRMAGSHSLWDIAAYHPSQGWRVIQVKTNRLPSPDECTRLKLARVPTGTRKEIWVWKTRKDEPHIVRLENPA